jgi:hypothetical protein
MREIRNGREWDTLLTRLQQDFEERYGKAPEEVTKVKHNGPSALAVPQSVYDEAPPLDPKIRIPVPFRHSFRRRSIP